MEYLNEPKDYTKMPNWMKDKDFINIIDIKY